MGRINDGFYAFTEIQRLAGQMWKKADEKTKAIFFAEFKKINDQYAKALHKYEANLSSDQRELMKQQKQEKKNQRKQVRIWQLKNHFTVLGKNCRKLCFHNDNIYHSIVF